MSTQPPAGGARSPGRMVETVLLALVLGAMVVLAATQIILRNVLGSGIDWADEALRLMVLWVAMLGAVAASGEQRHVSIDAVARYLPPRARHAVGRLVSVVAAAVCGVLAWYSWQFVAESLEAGEMVLGGRVPAWAAESVLPAGFALMTLRYVAAAVGRGGAATGGVGGH